MLPRCSVFVRVGETAGENGFCDFGAEFAVLTPIREAGQREAGSVKSAKNAGNSGFSRKFTDTALTMLAKMCRSMDFGGRCSVLRLVMRMCGAP